MFLYFLSRSNTGFVLNSAMRKVESPVGSMMMVFASSSWYLIPAMLSPRYFIAKKQVGILVLLAGTKNLSPWKSKRVSFVVGSKMLIPTCADFNGFELITFFLASLPICFCTEQETRTGKKRRIL